MVRDPQLARRLDGRSSADFGPATTASFGKVEGLDRTRVAAAIERRELLCRALRRALAGGDLLCLPTAPSVARSKATSISRARGTTIGMRLALTSIAGIGRLPQVSMPLANVSGVPIGLSLAAAQGEDARLLDVAQMVDERFRASG